MVQKEILTIFFKLFSDMSKYFQLVEPFLGQIFRNLNNILLERKIGREDPRVGGNVNKRIAHTIHNLTAYAWVLSASFSLQEDMKRNNT